MVFPKEGEPVKIDLAGLSGRKLVSSVNRHYGSVSNFLTYAHDHDLLYEVIKEVAGIT